MAVPALPYIPVVSVSRLPAASAVPGDGILQHGPADGLVLTYVNPDNPLDIIRRAYPYRDLSTEVDMGRHKDWSRGTAGGQADGKGFVLVAPEGFAPAAAAGGDWRRVPMLADAADSLRYVGQVIEASRAFRVGFRIFSNLGQIVNKLDFTVPPEEFAKLGKGKKAGTRRLAVLWNNRTALGNPAGTGAYILKSRVTLLPVPGGSPGPVSRSDPRTFGILLSP